MTMMPLGVVGGRGFPLGSGDLLIPDMTAATTDGVTITHSYAYSGATVGWRACDRDTGTYWAGRNGLANPDWLQVDFGVGNAKAASSYTIRTGGLLQMMTAWRIQGSNDGITWVTLDTRTDFDDYAIEAQFPIETPAPFRYYRILADAGEGTFTYLAEFQLIN